MAGLTAAGAALVGTGIQVLGQLGTNGMNAGFASGQTAKQRKYNEAMYNRQLQDILHYSSPAYQVQKLKEAGLNPYLAINGGQTIQTPTSLPNETAKAQFANPFDAVGQLPLLKAQIDNINADTAKKKEDTKTGQLDNAYKEMFNTLFAQPTLQAQLDKLLKENNLLTKQGNLVDSQVDLNEKQLDKMNQEIINLINNANLTDAQIKEIEANVAMINANKEYQDAVNAFKIPLLQRGIDPDKNWVDNVAKIIQQFLLGGQNFRGLFPTIDSLLKKFF